MPPHRTFDCRIDIVPGSKPPHGRVYSLTVPEDEELKQWLDDMLNKGFIRPSTSPYGAPCFFVKRPGKKLRLCMDYRALNSVTEKDRNPIPLVSDLLRTVSTGKFFSIIDLRGAYNLLRVKEGHEFKTAFLTKYGQFEMLVMPFGLANAPAQWQTLINHLLKTCQGFCVVYLDDIVVYSQNKTEHWNHVRKVLDILRSNNLFAKMEKCHFCQEEITFLGYIIGKHGLKMDPAKTRSISDWAVPTSVKELQVFLGSVNFYRRFIPDFADLTQPLTHLLKKGALWDWTEARHTAFLSLKEAFSKEVILKNPDDNKPFIVETDASNYALGGVLSQFNQNNILQPIAFFSRQMIPAERNYEIYDKELLAIHECFREWRQFLQGSRHPVSVICDHKNLQYFMTTKQLTRRQARWSLFFSEFDFTLTHRAGSLNGKADLLSRQPAHYVSQEPSNFVRLIDPITVISTLQATPSSHSVSLIHSTALAKDIDTELDWPLLICDHLMTDSWLPMEEDLLAFCKREEKHFLIQDERFFRLGKDNRTKTPYMGKEGRLGTIKRFHDGLGHLKFDSIVELITRRFWWPSMKKQIKLYIRTCPQCQLAASSSSNQNPTPLRPVPPVALPFERWAIDFVGPFRTPSKAGNIGIMTAICYGTRWVIARPVRQCTKETVANFLYDEILMNYGSPFEIFSDRAKAFLADGIKEFEKIQGIRHFATTPYHPQTNGMVERMHAMLGHAIRTLVESKANRWDEYLNQAIFAIRVRTHAVTGFSPFYLLYGVEPRMPGDTEPLESNMQPLDEIERMEALSEFNARTFEELGNHRAAAYHRSKAQAEVMKRRHNLDSNSSDYYFKIGDMVKLKQHKRGKFGFRWSGPWFIRDVGFPGTYYLMNGNGDSPSFGASLDGTVNQQDLAPWLKAPEEDRSYFYGPDIPDYDPEPIDP